MAERHVHGGHRELQRRALRIALVANGAFLGVEVAGGLLFNSLALLADAAHMLSDVAALGIALFALRLLDRPATTEHTFGLQRAEVLGAQLNAVTLFAASGWILYEAVRRLGEPPEVLGGGLLVVATTGLVVNVGSAALLARAAGRSLNMRGAYVHMALDAAGSVAAIAAGVSVVAWDALWVDPVVSIAIAALVLWSAGRLMRETVHVLLEGVPRHLAPEDVEAHLFADDAVEDVHHLHLWSLASDVPALSAHVVLAGELSLHDAQEEGDRLRRDLRERFGIEHTTLELECHGCEGPVVTDPGREASPRG